MPKVNVKSFTEILEALTKMTEGVKRYKNDTGFPPSIKEEVLLTMMENLRSARESYDQTTTKAKLLYDKYNSLVNESNSELSRYNTMLYGFYGKKNQVVNDFGIKPFKSKVKKANTVPALTKEPVPINQGQAA